jgi:hypothetical protein
MKKNLTAFPLTKPSKKFGQDIFEAAGFLRTKNRALAVAASMSGRLRRYMPMAS